MLLQGFPFLKPETSSLLSLSLSLSVLCVDSEKEISFLYPFVFWWTVRFSAINYKTEITYFFYYLGYWWNEDKDVGISCTFFFFFFAPLSKYLEMKLLDHMLIMLQYNSISLNVCTNLFIIYITAYVWEFPYIHYLNNMWYVFSFW